jgi:hypothetical protein
MTPAVPQESTQGFMRLRWNFALPVRVRLRWNFALPVRMRLR